MQRIKMDFANFWLPIFGAGLLWTIAVSAWFGDQKVPAVWFGFVGSVLLLLLFALQIQQVISAKPRPGIDEIAKRQLRANVLPEMAETTNIDDDLMTIGPE